MRNDMDTTTLIDRYIDTAMRTVPERQRTDLAAELRERITDELEARVAAGERRDDVERAVLTELGDPELLAAAYTDRPLRLIGPRYYLDWWRLLKVLWIITLPCTAFGLTLGQVTTGADFGELVGSVVVALISVFVHIGFWTTLLFVIIEHTSEQAPETHTQWTPDLLPPIRENTAGTPELIANIVYVVVASGALIWDSFIGFTPGRPGLSLLDPSLWPWWIGGALLILVLHLLRAIGTHVKGHWDDRAAINNTIITLMVVAAVLLLLTQGQLLNPEFFPTVVGEDGDLVTMTVNIVAGFVILGMATASIIDGFRRARRGPTGMQ